MRRVSVGVVVLLAAALGPALAGPAVAGPGEDVLRRGERLAPGQALLAPDGRHVLVVQPDGTLGLYGFDEATPRWSSGRGTAGASLVTDTTGDVRLVAPDGAVLWSTSTAGSDGMLRLRADGDVVVEVPGGGTVWSSGTARAPSVLVGPGRLEASAVLTSPDGRHTLLVDPDAGVQLRGPDGTVRWAPDGSRGTGSQDEVEPATALHVRADGNLVAVDDDGDVVWRSRTAGRGPVSLAVQDDGDLVLLDTDGAAVWRSGTPIGPSEAEPGAVLAAGASWGSPTGHLGLALESGALVATWDGEPFWSSPTGTGATATLQVDGDLVVRDAQGTPLWATGTGGWPGARLVLEESAVVIVTPQGQVLWQLPVPDGLVPAEGQPADCGSVDGPVGSGDVVRTRSGIRVHPCLADALDALVTAARADGVELGGGGWRSSEQQVALRRAHCGPTDADVYEAPASACSPSTARPGTSRHERGLAIDFTEAGRTLTTSSAAYRWLVEHAGAHGLENLPGEPWHWSVDGS